MMKEGKYLFNCLMVYTKKQYEKGIRFFNVLLVKQGVKIVWKNIIKTDILCGLALIAPFTLSDPTLQNV